MQDIRRLLNHATNPWEKVADNLIASIAFVVVTFTGVGNTIYDALYKHLGGEKHPTLASALTFFLGGIMSYVGWKLQSGTNDVLDLVGGTILGVGAYVAVKSVVVAITAPLYQPKTST